MLSADALHGVNDALNFVMRHGKGLRGHMSFGLKSVLAAGDLYQLPAVERLYYEEQVYHSYLWSEFKLAELTDICRVRPEEVEFVGLLSRARRGYKHLTRRDIELLNSRVCKNHNPACRCFKDVMRIRPPGVSRTRRPISAVPTHLPSRPCTPSLPGGRRQDEKEVSQEAFHCPPSVGASVLAARRHKVDELNAQYAQTYRGPLVWAVAEDRHAATLAPVLRESEREKIDAKRSNFTRKLPLHIGMQVLSRAPHTVAASSQHKTSTALHGLHRVRQELHRHVS